jgi:glycosyltransferase involved in cell wall biosynthesis
MISIAMAAYNGEKYIREQLDSILNQTYQNFELIICDDCSTDPTWVILQEYKLKDDRIQCYLNEKNLGFKKNFEKAIGLCKGEYIALSDQDDIWKYDHLEILVDSIGENYICCGSALIMNENGQNFGRKTVFDYLGRSLFLDDYTSVENILVYKSPYQGASMLFTKSFLKIALPIPDAINMHDTWFVLLGIINHQFVFVNKVINYYRQHDGTASGGVLSKNIVVSTINMFKRKKREKPFRLCFCYALLERLPEIEKGMKDIIIKTKDFYENSRYFIFRLKYVPYLYSRYKITYGTDLHFILLKIAKYLLFRFR